MKLAGEIRSSGVTVTLVVHEHKRLGRGTELSMLAEQLKSGGADLELLTGELKGSHDPSGVVFTVLAATSGMECEYLRDRILEGHESARKRGRTAGGVGATDNGMPPMAFHLRGRRTSLRNIAKRLVITTGTDKGRHLSPHHHADAPRTRRADGHRGQYVIPRRFAAGLRAGHRGPEGRLRAPPAGKTRADRILVYVRSKGAGSCRSQIRREASSG
ncbi:recombinase family protein [Streptomyces sp. NPDC056178]|uniref:recombinase family protein n=1 Tax=Streptomyces sp. NPDC056178 TaxID=3345735 RepID=UPI0035E169F5